MMHISAVSNGREYAAATKKKAKRKTPLKPQPAWFEFHPSRTWNGTFFPESVEIGCQYNAVEGQTNLDSGPRHIRKGSFKIPFHDLLDICLDVMEQDEVSLTHPQFNRLLRILADQHQKKKHRRPGN